MFGRATGFIQLQLPFAHGKLVLIIYARVLHKVIVAFNFLQTLNYPLTIT